MDDLAAPQKISPRTFDWLRDESRQWVADGMVDEEGRAQILSRYVTESSPHRATMALSLIAVLMCGIGVLLVIGYNWDRIPPAAKVAMIMASTALAFTGAALAHARDRRTPGEVLSAAGTLLFGNGIWLIAQVLHIQGHFPDAFLWFAVGAIVTAFLVDSAAIGAGAAILAAAWIISEASFYPHIIWPFLLLWSYCVWVAYRLGSPVMIRVLGLTAALWVAFATIDESHMTVWPAAVVLTSCALYAVGRWHEETHHLGDAWRMSGLGALLLMIVPLMVSGLYADLHAGAQLSTVLIMATAAATALSAAARPLRSPADRAVLAGTAVAATWAAVVSSGLFAPGWWLTMVSTVAFSAVSLVLCVTLIRSAFRSNRTADLVFGVLFGLAFLIVRWTSVIENLLWSGLLLLVTGGGLLFVARQWLRRDHSLVAGRAS